MRTGLFLTGSDAGESGPAEYARRTVDLVREARDAGLHAVGVGQHLISAPTRYLQPVPLLARLIPETGGMDLVTGVILLPLFHPVQVAEEIATLDVLSGGRAVMGVGAGYRQEELDAFGVKRSHRAARLEESLTVIRALWRGEPVIHRGTEFQLDVPALSLPPLRAGGPPVWLAAMGAAPLARARRLDCTPFIGPRVSLPELGEWCADPELLGGFERIALRRELYLTKQPPAAAWASAVARIGSRYDEYRRWGLTDGADEGDLRGYLAQRAVVGGPEECVETLLSYRGLGVTDVLVRCSWPGMTWEETREMVRLLGAEVIPALRSHTEN